MLKGLLRTPVLFYCNGTASSRSFNKRTDEAGMRRVAQFAQRLRFDLANTFARDGEYLADFLESPRITIVETETHAEHTFLAGAQFPQHCGHFFLEAQVYRCLRWRDYRLVFDEIAKMR